MIICEIRNTFASCYIVNKVNGDRFLTEPINRR